MSEAWSVSTDEEHYYGEHSSREEAIAAGMEEVSEGGRFWIGLNEKPIQPEDWWNAEDWLENVSCQDDYSVDVAEGWDGSTKSQREELEADVRSVMAKWLDRYGLRPAFWMVRRPQEFVSTNGVAVEKTK